MVSEAVNPGRITTRELYVTLSERIVRAAIAWQDASGRIVDPFVGRETPTATPRFVGALAGLLLQGRCRDLAEHGRKALTVAAEDLSAATERGLAGAEFYTKELVLGYLALADETEGATVGRWRRLLGEFDPAKVYQEVLGKRPADALHNFCTFGLAGEGLKRMCGLAANDDFIERHLATQLDRFTASGLYRDPHCPMVYDAVGRMNLSLLLHAGYRGPLFAEVDELLRRGALTMLSCLSPTGEAPYGGRSNQQNFNEATVALICEFEANRWRRRGELAQAGTFKQAARRATQSVRRWLDLEPVRFTKNEFPPESQHGRQKTYGFYAAYSLLIASQFGFAGWLADSTLAEAPDDAGARGRVSPLSDDFHKVFATHGAYHVEIDTRADFHYDATGLGRLHKTGVPTETALSTPIVADPDFLLSVPAAPRNVAIGPGWVRDGQLTWLANLSAEIQSVDVEVIEESEIQTAFRLVYHLAASGGSISETYRLSRDGLEIECAVSAPTEAVCFQVPLIRTDGRHRSRVETGSGAFHVSYQGHAYCVQSLDSSRVENRLEEFAAPNRNGVYDVGVFTVRGNCLRCRLSLE